jgi:hypothetical protein
MLYLSGYSLILAIDNKHSLTGWGRGIVGVSFIF